MESASALKAEPEEVSVPLEVSASLLQTAGKSDGREVIGTAMPAKEKSIVLDESEKGMTTMIMHLSALEASLKPMLAAVNSQMALLLAARAQEDVPIDVEESGEARHSGTTQMNEDENARELKQPQPRWMPLAVRKMPPLTANSVPIDQAILQSDVKDLDTFTSDFLTTILGGHEWSHGLLYPATGTENWNGKGEATPKQLLPDSKSYYILDAALEPFLPQKPGEHGAKLSVIFRDADDEFGEKRYDCVPLFVRLEENASIRPYQYTYMGHYSQTRWSDKLDYDRVHEIVPEDVKLFWSEILTHHNRPAWVRKKLMQSFWPRPEYAGVLNKPMILFEDTSIEVVDKGTLIGDIGGTGKHADIEEQLSEDMKDFIEETCEWEKSARAKERKLEPQDIIMAFERSDSDEMPGLRFWWEYLQCVHYDRNFYYMLVTQMKAYTTMVDPEQRGYHNRTSPEHTSNEHEHDEDVSSFSLEGTRDD